MITINDFINSRNHCFCCGSNLEICIESFSLQKTPSLLLKNNILLINSSYFDIHIDLLNNYVIKGCDKSHWEFKLVLFCPLHKELPKDIYKYELIFDIYCGKIANETPIEYLMTDNFILQSFPSLDEMEYVSLKSNKKITFPYFDYSQMSLPKLKSKLKTYLLMQ